MPIRRAFAALAGRASTVVDDRQFCPISSTGRFSPVNRDLRTALHDRAATAIGA